MNFRNNIHTYISENLNDMGPRTSHLYLKSLKYLSQVKIGSKLIAKLELIL